MATPSTGGPAVLHAVTAVSPGDGWAVGGATSSGKTVILRWTGTAWRRVTSPSPAPPGGFSELNGVAATSPTSAWAVFAAMANGKTAMTDVVQFESPLGLLGSLADRLIFDRYLPHLLRQRNTWLKTMLETRT